MGSHRYGSSPTAEYCVPYLLLLSENSDRDISPFLQIPSHEYHNVLPASYYNKIIRRISLLDQSHQCGFKECETGLESVYAN